MIFDALPRLACAALGKVSHRWRTLGEWLDVYETLLEQRDYDPQTIKNYKANLKHVRRLWGATVIRSLKPHHISTALKEFLPDRSSTARRVLSALRDAFVEAVANGWAETSPAVHVRPPPCKIKRKRLSFEVWQRLRAQAASGRQKWVEPMLLLALVTGQRRADLGKMRFDDIVDGHLQVEQQKQAGKGYGARVSIPLALRLDAIGMTLGDVIEMCKACGAPGPTLLRTKGGGAIELSSLSARFNELIRKVLGEAAHNFREWPTLHEIRSLAARMFRAQGIDVQRLLGHKHAEMTAIYEDDRGLSAGEWKRVALVA